MGYYCRHPLWEERWEERFCAGRRTYADSWSVDNMLSYENGNSVRQYIAADLAVAVLTEN